MPLGEEGRRGRGGGGVSTARFGDLEVEEEKGEVRSRLQCREARKRGTERRAER